MTDLVTVVSLNHGRWVATCPRPLCLNAEQAGRCDDGTQGGLDPRTGMFHCRTTHGGCGITIPARWPPNVTEIEALVMCRPVPATRNWQPGEDLSALVTENLRHGIVPTAALEGRPTGPLLEVYGGELRAGDLESTALPELEG